MGVERSRLYTRRELHRLAGAILTTTVFAVGVPVSAILEPSKQNPECLIDHRLVSRKICPPAVESNLSNIPPAQLPEASTLVIEPLKIVEQESQKLEPQITPVPKPTESPTPALQLPQAQAKENKEVSFECSVLYYHEISPVQFKIDLMVLIRKGYKSLSLEEYAAILKEEKSIPSYPTFLVTFDDGLKSQLNALPVIEEIQKEKGIFVPLTLFSIMRFEDLGDKTIAQMPDNTLSFNDGAHRYLTKADLINLIKLGHNVQNHTMFHSNLPKLSEKEMQNEILYAEKRVNQLWEVAGKKRAVKAFAYPLGAYGVREENFLASIGIDVAFTTESRTTQSFSRRKMLPRIRRS